MSIQRVLRTLYPDAGSEDWSVSVMCGKELLIWQASYQRPSDERIAELLAQIGPDGQWISGSEGAELEASALAESERQVWNAMIDKAVELISDPSDPWTLIWERSCRRIIGEFAGIKDHIATGATMPERTDVDVLRAWLIADLLSLKR